GGGGGLSGGRGAGGGGDGGGAPRRPPRRSPKGGSRCRKCSDGPDGTTASCLCHFLSGLTSLARIAIRRLDSSLRVTSSSLSSGSSALATCASTAVSSPSSPPPPPARTFTSRGPAALRRKHV